MPFFRFRPEHDTRAQDPTDPIEWEDNWLSNSIAASSYYLLPAWCQSEAHFSSRFTAYLWTSCPCCATYRGMVIAALPLSFIIVVLLLVIAFS